MNEIHLVDRDLSAVARWSAAFRGMGLGVSLIESRNPIRSATQLARLHPAAMVVGCNGTESVLDVRQLVEEMEGTRVTLLVPAMPPPASVARIVSAHGGAILPRDEAPIVIASTIVAMLASAGVTHE